MDEKRSFTVPIVVALLVLLLLLYVGGYYATVERTLPVFRPYLKGDLDWVPLYKVGEHPSFHRLLAKFFYPVHCVDRWIRRDYWNGELRKQDDGVEFNL